MNHYDIVVQVARQQNDQKLTYRKLVDFLNATKLLELFNPDDLTKLKQAWREFKQAKGRLH